eukprot:1157249-Pelagomonas_calceolata.AAC.12
MHNELGFRLWRLGLTIDHGTIDNGRIDDERIDNGRIDQCWVVDAGQQLCAKLHASGRNWKGGIKQLLTQAAHTLPHH